MAKHRGLGGDIGGGNCFCCCNPFTCCCKCIFNCICTCICQIIVTLLVILAIIAFVCWLIFRPNAVKFYASQSQLTEFNLSATTPNNNNLTLRYDLNVNLTIRNPNKRIGIYYDRIEATAFYQGQRFSTVDLQPFFQGHKSTANVSAVFKGQSMVLLGGKKMGKYNDERSSDVYSVDLKLYLRVRLKFLFVRSSMMKPKIDCHLSIPMKTDSTNQPNGIAFYKSKRCMGLCLAMNFSIFFSHLFFILSS